MKPSCGKYLELRKRIQTLKKFLDLTEVIGPYECQVKHKETRKISQEFEYIYGHASLFEVEANAAVRLSQFLSGFYQNVDGLPGDRRQVIREDKLLPPKMLYAEVLANVISNVNIQGSGIFYLNGSYYDPIAEKVRSRFAPYSYRTDKSTGLTYDYHIIDYGKSPRSYESETWFLYHQNKWNQETIKQLDQYSQKLMMRDDLKGSKLVHHKTTTMVGIDHTHGIWTPHLPCDGHHRNQWLATYTVPFFTKVSTQENPVFSYV